MTYTFPLSASFGKAKTGLAAYYKITDSSGSVVQARTDSGVTEITGSGVYQVNPTVDSDWGLCRVTWDIDSLPGVVAEATVNFALEAGVIDHVETVGTVDQLTNNNDKGGYSLSGGSIGDIQDGLATAEQLESLNNLSAEEVEATVEAALESFASESLPTNPTAGSRDEALLAAWGDGFGRMEVDTSTNKLRIYGPDGSTVIREFNVTVVSDVPTGRAPV